MVTPPCCQQCCSLLHNYLTCIYLRHLILCSGRMLPPASDNLRLSKEAEWVVVSLHKHITAVVHACVHTHLHTHTNNSMLHFSACSLSLTLTIFPLWPHSCPFLPLRLNQFYISIQRADGASVSEVLTCQSKVFFFFPIYILLICCFASCNCWATACECYTWKSPDITGKAWPHERKNGLLFHNQV